METAGVLVRPPWLFGGALVLGTALDMLVPVPLLPRPWHRAGWALVVPATGWIVWGLLALRRAGTPVDPHRPTAALVAAGPFRFSRNPLYLGLTVLCAGLALLFENPWIIVLLLPAFGVLQWGVVHREERYLERLFGAEYRAYCARVRRWL